MARPKLYDKRFHFNGPAELDARVHALAERRTTARVPGRRLRTCCERR